jgi:predicted nucleic acid-binding protein
MRNSRKSHLETPRETNKGKRIHDANIAATMIRHGYPKILTANPRDFTKIEEIEVIAL